MPDFLKFVPQVNFIWLVIATLAAWRITNALVFETISLSFRRLIGMKIKSNGMPQPQNVQPNFFAKLLACFWCSSMWVSVGVFLIWMVFPYILIPFAISGLSILVEVASDR